MIQIFQKFRRRRSACHEKVVTSASASDVKKVAFCVVNVLKIGFIGNHFNPFLEGNDFVVTTHYRDCPEFQTLGQVHGADG